MPGIFFPESIYPEYRDRFVNRPPIHRYYGDGQSLAAATINTPSYPIPSDMDASFSYLAARTISGPGQIAKAVHVILTMPSGGSQFVHLAPTITPVANDYNVWFMPWPPMFEAGSTFYVQFIFSAGGVNNATLFNSMICMWPRMKL